MCHRHPSALDISRREQLNGKGYRMLTTQIRATYYRRRPGPPDGLSIRTTVAHDNVRPSSCGATCLWSWASWPSDCRRDEYGEMLFHTALLADKPGYGLRPSRSGERCEHSTGSFPRHWRRRSHDWVRVVFAAEAGTRGRSWSVAVSSAHLPASADPVRRTSFFESSPSEAEKKSGPTWRASSCSREVCVLRRHRTYARSPYPEIKAVHPRPCQARFSQRCPSVRGMQHSEG